MRRHFLFLVASTLTLRDALAAPGGTPQIAQCTLKFDDPTTWDKSNASTYLNVFLKEHGTKNWLNLMDELTTGSEDPPCEELGCDEQHQQSNLNCADILGGNACRSPTKECKFYTPPEVWYIRNAASVAHDMLNMAYERLSIETIQQSLEIEQMVEDFGADFFNRPRFETNEILDIFGAALAATAGLTGIASGPLGGGIGFLGGVLSTVSLVLPNPAEEVDDFKEKVKLSMKKRISVGFEAQLDSLQNQAMLLFGGEGDLTTLAGQSDTADESPIAKVFAGGKFLVHPDPGIWDQVGQWFEDSLGRMKQALVAEIFSALGYFIMIDTDRTQNDCNQIFGSRWFNDQCYMLSRRGGDPAKHSVIPIGADTMKLLDYPEFGYNMNIETLYRTSHECEDTIRWYRDYGMSGSPTRDYVLWFLRTDPVSENGKLSTCFYSIPTIKAKGGPCTAMMVDGVEIPEELGYTNDACAVTVVLSGVKSN